jgi:hypothetical protein
MKAEAASAGFYISPLNRRYPRIQILTIDELLKGKQIDYPRQVNLTFKKADKVKQDRFNLPLPETEEE